MGISEKYMAIEIASTQTKSTYVD